MKKAYKKYGISIPEMEEQGVIAKCENCAELAPPG
jgi:hypothetical protein